MTAPSDRLPPIAPADWTDAQRIAAEEVIRGPRGGLISPFVPMLRSPELMTHAQRMGEYLRYRSALGLRLSEFAILLVACAWSQQVEWTIHAPIAEREGVSADTIAAIAEGRLPEAMADDERIVHAFWSELELHRSVSDETWARAIAAFGEAGVVDLLGIVGYYGFLAMTMNAARTAVPPSQAAWLKRLAG
ncbi:4-carboxymuconolactone decarboxylase domain-containing protein [Burkholderiales bacterium 8X]|nr:4-carboxymuconolactone decarboxylase domain-containing protein [Burkholderiales bacterium 8X]